MSSKSPATARLTPPILRAASAPSPRYDRNGPRLNPLWRLRPVAWPRALLPSEFVEDPALKPVLQGHHLLPECFPCRRQSDWLVKLPSSSPARQSRRSAWPGPPARPFHPPWVERLCSRHSVAHWRSRATTSSVPCAVSADLIAAWP